MLIITRIPNCDARLTRSFRSSSLYAGSAGSDASAGRVGAIDGQLAVVWMTDAPVEAADWRFEARLGDQRKLGSSKNPIGMNVAAFATPRGAADATSARINAKQVAFFMRTSSSTSPNQSRGTVAEAV